MHIINTLHNAFFIVESAKNITGKEDYLEIINSLYNDPQNVQKFKNRILVTIENTTQSNSRVNTMIISSTLGLIFCLCVLIFYKGSLPGEAIGIISTIAGMFGACLKDAYGIEYKNKNKIIDPSSMKP